MAGLAHDWSIPRQGWDEPGAGLGWTGAEADRTGARPGQDWGWSGTQLWPHCPALPAHLQALEAGVGAQHPAKDVSSAAAFWSVWGC